MRILLFLIVILSRTCIPSSATVPADEFYIVTEAPVAVGGGMIRYYDHSAEEPLSVRFSFRGIVGDNICIERTAFSRSTGTFDKKLLKVPLERSFSRNEALWQVGPHTVRLKVNEYGRVSVRKVKTGSS